MSGSSPRPGNTTSWLAIGFLPRAVAVAGLGIFGLVALSIIGISVVLEYLSGDLRDPPFVLEQHVASDLYVEVEDPICSSAGGGGVYLRADRRGTPRTMLFDLDGECFAGEAEFFSGRDVLRLAVWCTEQEIAFDRETLEIDVLVTRDVTAASCGALP